eukprot:GILK01014632.1.p1 GENE.GILK01014632.1~~GILK01014632.1.p1  ORF type:complete len:300 (-),score=33.79 GILK01014632.1:108-947(-)
MTEARTDECQNRRTRYDAELSLDHSHHDCFNSGAESDFRWPNNIHKPSTRVAFYPSFPAPFSLLKRSKKPVGAVADLVSERRRGKSGTTRTTVAETKENRDAGRKNTGSHRNVVSSRTSIRASAQRPVVSRVDCGVQYSPPPVKLHSDATTAMSPPHSRGTMSVRSPLHRLQHGNIYIDDELKCEQAALKWGVTDKDIKIDIVPLLDGRQKILHHGGSSGYSYCISNEDFLSKVYDKTLELFFVYHEELSNAIIDDLCGEEVHRLNRMEAKDRRRQNRR